MCLCVCLCVCAFVCVGATWLILGFGSFYLPCRSLGCTVIEMLTANPPFHFCEPMAVLLKIATADEDFCSTIPDGACVSVCVCVSVRVCVCACAPVCVPPPPPFVCFCILAAHGAFSSPLVGGFCLIVCFVCSWCRCDERLPCVCFRVLPSRCGAAANSRCAPRIRICHHMNNRRRSGFFFFFFCVCVCVCVCVYARAACVLFGVVIDPVTLTHPLLLVCVDDRSAGCAVAWYQRFSFGCCLFACVPLCDCLSTQLHLSPKANMPPLSACFSSILLATVDQRAACATSNFFFRLSDLIHNCTASFLSSPPLPLFSLIVRNWLVPPPPLTA